jgi:hypothetical protein
MTPLAHVAGLPIEETLPMMLPAVCALALAARATLAQARRRLRRRQPGRSRVGRHGARSGPASSQSTAGREP